MSERVRLGVVGYGQQGRIYAQLIAEGRVPSMVLGAITNPRPAGRERAAADHPDVPVFADHLEAIAVGAVDALLIVIPHYEHAKVAMEALERGVHVLVEKPVGVYSKQVAQLNSLAASRPKTAFAVMFNQRANPLFARIKEIVDAGEIGEVLRSNWTITNWWRPQAYYDSSPWRGTWGGEGGGVLVNQAPHQLDLWQWICGKPKSVFSKVGYGFARNIAVEDEVTALVDYGNGRTGVFVTATHDIVGSDRFEILGSQGKIVVDDSKAATVTRLAKPERELSESMAMEEVNQLFRGKLDTSGLYSTERIEFEPTPWGTQHATVMENFAQHILNGTPLLAPGSDGMNGVRLANAIHLSSWLGQEVPIDFDDDEFLAELNKRITIEGKYPPRS